MLPKAPDLQSFWRNVVKQVMPLRRSGRTLQCGPVFRSDRRARDKIYSRWGGFLEDAPFDPCATGFRRTRCLRSTRCSCWLWWWSTGRWPMPVSRSRFSADKTSVIFGLSGGLGDLGIQYAVRSLLGQFIDHAPEGLLEQLPEWTEDSFAASCPT